MAPEKEADLAAYSAADAEVGASTDDSPVRPSRGKDHTPSYITRLDDKYKTSVKTGHAISEGLSDLLKCLIRDRANGKKAHVKKQSPPRTVKC